MKVLTPTFFPLPKDRAEPLQHVGIALSLKVWGDIHRY